LIEIINKQLLLQLVGYLYYWQMGFNSVFKGLISALGADKCSDLRPDRFSPAELSPDTYLTGG